MWTKHVLAITKQMRSNITKLNEAARKQESEEVEEWAKELECQAGSLVAAMQAEGIWVGLRDASNERITTGQFPET